MLGCQEIKFFLEEEQIFLAYLFSDGLACLCWNKK